MLVDRWREIGPSEQLAVRAGHVYSPRLTQLELTPSARTGMFSGKGSFLITGAFGGLGLRLAGWMAQQGAARLVLAGRKVSEHTRSRVEALRGLGVDVLSTAVDVSNEHDVRVLIGSLPADFQPLRGVFHLALELSDAALLNQSADTLRAPLRSKAQAAWHLHRATEGMPLEHFVLFSSVLSAIGGAGQANYTAACAAVDALALHRRAQGLPALAIGWGPWHFAESAGLAAIQHTRAFSAIFPMPVGIQLQNVARVEPCERLDRGARPREWKRPRPLLADPIGWNPRRPVPPSRIDGASVPHGAAARAECRR